MAVQGLNNQQSVSIPSYSLPKKSDRSDNNSPFPGSTGSRLNASITSEYYSAQKFAMEFTSADGDKVSFSYEAVEYSKTSMNIDAIGNEKDLKKLAHSLKHELKKMAQDAIKNFLKEAGIKVEEEQQTEETANSAIPEYWNAENTSQRIVDFALSFFDAFKGKGEEFLKTIKAGIEEGFKQAQDQWGGKFPDEVSDLIKNTHDLIIEKLDSWAKEKGILKDDAQVEVADVTK